MLSSSVFKSFIAAFFQVSIIHVTSTTSMATRVANASTAIKPIPLSAGLTCDNWAIVPDNAELAASCKQEDGIFVQSEIQISRCTANINGQIVCTVG